jgi:hypothetical protein
MVRYSGNKEHLMLVHFVLQWRVFTKNKGGV